MRLVWKLGSIVLKIDISQTGMVCPGEGFARSGTPSPDKLASIGKLSAFGFQFGACY